MGNDVKVGLISCSGEEIAEGTLSRAAVRIVLEKLRPLQTVTICLPLFLAGDGGERAFVERYPTIAVDGCGKRCAQQGTEKYSGKVDDVVVIDELLEKLGEKAPASRRDFTEKDWELAEKVALEIARKVDLVLAKAAQEGRAGTAGGAPLPECSCSSSGPRTVSVKVQGKTLELVALDGIFSLVSKNGELSDGERGQELARQAGIYNAIPEAISSASLGEALLREYMKGRKK
ncbi:MAG: putative zinc-binding protein [Candidatus Eremiobacteraeota bacterium]|nr:putative zinc-binding protein [Candidatus Eremiobacteraeota bacterium]